MSLVDVTHESLGQLLERDVPEAHVLIAKNSVLGLDAAGIADILGVTTENVEAIEADADYKQIRLLVAAKHNEGTLKTDLTWDALEGKALENLHKRLQLGGGDVETNLRIAVAANRAQRRHLPQNRTLDASRAGERVQLRLTKRIVERLTHNGAERETTQELSVLNGGASNISFETLDEHLGVNRKPRTVANYRIHQAADVIDQGELEHLMDSSAKR